MSEITDETPVADPEQQKRTGQGEMPFAMVEGQPMTQLPLDLYIPPDALEVFLDAFEGPLDLLLYLIKRQNLDILDIKVAEITRQYMDYIDLMTNVQLELAAEYLVMAAVLAEIKSRMLLPRHEEDEHEEDDALRIGHRTRHRGEQRPRRQRLGVFQRVVSAGYHDFPIGFIDHGLEFAGRQNPCQDQRDDHHDEHQRKRVRNAEWGGLLACLGFGHLGSGPVVQALLFWCRYCRQAGPGLRIARNRSSTGPSGFEINIIRL
jgi:hypothetical protein